MLPVLYTNNILISLMNENLIKYRDATSLIYVCQGGQQAMFKLLET